MATLKENIKKAISDFDGIETAIQDCGIEVPYGTDTSEYGDKVREVYEKAYASGYNDGIPKSYILQDNEGTEILATVVDSETIFTATENDIREGTVAATEKGVTVGTKVIPSYHTTEGIKVITAGNSFTIKLPILNRYDYTKLQAIICSFNCNMLDSVAAERVSIDNGVYAVNSTEIIASVTKDDTNKTIDLGIVNDTDEIKILRYFTYKEIE